MTIRPHIDAREANRLYTAFEEGCANAPAGTFERAIAIRDRIGYLCDEFLDGMKELDVSVCNCDGIREIEVLMFDMLRRKNDAGQIPAMIAFGLALQEQTYQHDRDTIINRVRRDGNFWATREEWERFGLLDPEGTGASGLAEAALLQAGLDPAGYVIVDDEPVIDDDPDRFPGYDERV